MLEDIESFAKAKPSCVVPATQQTESCSLVAGSPQVLVNLVSEGP